MSETAKERVRQYLRSYLNLRPEEEMSVRQLAIEAIELSRTMGAPSDDLLIAVAELVDRFGGPLTPYLKDRKMARRADPYKDMVPAKIGTIPMLVLVHGKDKGKIEPGKYIRVKYHRNNPWETVFVTRVNPDGHFFADK